VKTTTAPSDDTGVSTPRDGKRRGFFRAVWEFFAAMKTAVALLIVLFFRAVWDFFASMKTAVVLLIVLAVVSVYGTAAEEYSALRLFGMKDLYHTAFYTALLALIGISLTVCGINRFGATWRATFRPKLSVSSKQIAAMQRSETLPSDGSLEDAATKVETALHAGSYHVSRVAEKEDVLLYAAKGRFGMWGPYLTHLSILFIFVGAIIGNRLGLDGFAIIKEGGYTETAYVRATAQETELGFRVKLMKFAIEYDENHNPTAYKSDLQVYQGDELVAGKVIDVNHPLTYDGVSFFQSNFGVSEIVLKIVSPNGETAWVPLAVDTESVQGRKRYSMTGMGFKQIVLGGRRLTIFARAFEPDYLGGDELSASDLPINPAVWVMVNDRLPEYKGLDAWADLGWLTQDGYGDFKGYRITLDDVVDYTGLQVVRNPGLPVVYAGFGLMLIGVFVAFYVPRKVVRVRVSPAKTGLSSVASAKEGVTVAVGGTSRGEPSAFDWDFARLRDALK